MKTNSWKFFSVLAVIIIAVIMVVPSIGMYVKKKDKPDMWPYKKINLGLDLQGGMHLVLEVETMKAVENRMELLVHEIKGLMKEKHYRHKGVTRVENDKISVTLEGKEQIDQFKTLIDKEFQILRKLDEKIDGEQVVMMFDLPVEEANYIKKLAADQAIETIRNRIDEFGVSEPDIRRQGENRIQIQLPGIKDTKRAITLIGKTAQLEFKLVDDENDLGAALKGDLPPGTEILYEHKEDPKTNRVSQIPYLLKKRVQMTGDSLTDARVRVDPQNNKPYVGIEFDNKGARLFATVTGENIKRRLAIVLDNKVYSAPVIQSKISGGSAQITGNFSMDEAHDLAIVLRAGALPAPVTIIEQRIVGPTLGMDSINKGMLSVTVGGLLVVLFMAFYYRGAGLIADFGVMLNIVFILAGLIMFDATLTLPGIAGIILTIGMSVDANVLIYERIREELRTGKTPRAAVISGFDRATITIIDSNLTTIIVAIVLFQFGSGPVKGFAVTLTIGLIASLFTALVVAKMIFDFFLDKRDIQSLSI